MGEEESLFILSDGNFMNLSSVCAEAGHTEKLALDLLSNRN